MGVPNRRVVIKVQTDEGSAEIEENITIITIRVAVKRR